MIVKISDTNKITLPEEILRKLPPTEFFEVSLEEGAIVLRPVTGSSLSLEGIREKMKKLGLTEEMLKEAIEWARKR